MPRKFKHLPTTALVFVAAAGVCPASAQPPSSKNGLSIAQILMKPTTDGFYDATVGFVMKDPKLGSDGAVTFSIVVPHVHDADEAIDKVHDPVKTFGDDLGHAYGDIHREP